MKSIRTVGLLGLGAMGRPMAKHLKAGGFDVIGYDPVHDACVQAEAQGARIVGSPREVAAACDLVFIVVGFDNEVERVVFGENGVVEGAKEGLIVAVGSTIAPQYTKRLAARLKERAVILLDVPLARGEKATIDGKLLIFGAGEQSAFEACRPALSSFANDIFYLGEAGAGQVGKMVNNLILWACTAANDEGFALAEALGVDRERLREALLHSSAMNWSMADRAERSGMPWAEKDMMIALAEADQARLSLPLSGSIKEVIKGLKIRMGLGMPKVPE